MDPNTQNPSPFKSGRKAALRGINGGDNPQKVKIDIAHTYAIGGFGKDFVASSVVFLSVHCAAFGEAKYEEQLEWAWQSFRTWCVENKKTTSITSFGKTDLKIISFLNLKKESLPPVSSWFRSSWFDFSIFMV